MQWFRFYNDAMRHPKVAKLSDAQFRLWVDLLCVASENEGQIPALNDLKHILKRRLDHLSRGLKDLLKAGLITCYGDEYRPSNWDKKQYKSDSSAERVKKHRQKCNVTVTPPETETEAETELEPKGSCASDDALKPSHIFEKWNEVADRLGKPRVRDLTPARRQLLNARIAQYSIEDFVTAFAKVEASAFLRGDGKWQGCTFDWILKRANFQKIIEGNYDA